MHIGSLVPQSGMLTANDFADLVFRAEGVALEKFRAPLRDAFRLPGLRRRGCSLAQMMSSGCPNSAANSMSADHP